jgi:hypothetical protein
VELRVVKKWFQIEGGDEPNIIVGTFENTMDLMGCMKLKMYLWL